MPLTASGSAALWVPADGAGTPAGRSDERSGRPSGPTWHSVAMGRTAERFPPQVRFIVGNEGCERFSFYGMRAILVVYMVQWLAMPEHEAKAAYHLFMMACYLTP